MVFENQIRTKLETNFQPTHLEVTNESFMHSVPAGSETHFKLVVVSSQFQGRPRVARHQAVYGLLAQELKQGVHALALHLFTPEEWTVKQNKELDSPVCHGGEE